MSRYTKQPLDFAGLHTVGLRERGGKIRTADFASPYVKGSGMGAWLDSLPRILAGRDLRKVADAIAARARPGSAPSSGPWAATSSSAAWRRC